MRISDWSSDVYSSDLQGAHPCREGGATGQRIQIRVSDRILRLDPGADAVAVADIGFEPAIGIGDGEAEQLVGDVLPLRIGIGEFDGHAAKSLSISSRPSPGRRDRKRVV